MSSLHSPSTPKKIKFKNNKGKTKWVVKGRRNKRKKVL
jgi:hypothetical protein